MTTIDTRWSGVLDAAERDGLLNELTMLCVAGDDIVPDHVFGEAVPSRPEGRPTRMTVRRAAGRILLLPASPRQRVIGLLTEYQSPTRWLTVGAPVDDELALFRANCEQAVLYATELDDPELIGWARLRAGKAAYGLMQRADSVRHLQAGVARLEQALAAEPLSTTGTIAEAAGQPSWLPERQVLLRVLLCKSLHMLCRVAESTGRYDFWAQTCDLFRRHAEPLIPVRPSLYAESLMHHAAIARAQGDRDKFRQLEADMSAVFPDKDGLTHPEVLRMRMGNAEALRDWDRAIDLCESYVRTIAIRTGDVLATDPLDPVEVLAFVDGMHAAGARHRLIAVGNAAYSMANFAYRNGSPAVDPSHWLDVADRCWQQVGVNGPCAVRLSRLRLQAGKLTGDELDEAIGAILEISQIGLRYVLRRNAVLDAARLCRPGDVRVHDRLLEMIESDPGAGIGHLARLRGGLAQWHFRAAQATRHRPKARRRWRQAGKLARTAAVALDRHNAMIDPELAADCWYAAAVAAGEQDQEGRHRQLELLVNAVRCAAQRLVSVSTHGERMRVEERYRPVFTQAADLALAENCPAALDFILEAMRRDRVGVVLAGLSHDVDVSQTVRSAVERVQATSAALNSPDADGVFTRFLPVAPDDMFERSAEVVSRRRRDAIANAEQVIGPLVALADVQVSDSPTAEEVLDIARADDQVAVLQFQRADVRVAGFLAFYQRLTWRDDEGTVQQFSGQVLLRAELVEVEPGRPEYFAARRLRELSQQLLPDQLLSLLDKAAQPIRLLIIPAGLFGVPFDALPLDNTTFLIDRAMVSLHSSLSAAASLARTKPLRAARAIAAYDPSLIYAGAELVALRRHLDVTELAGMKALGETLSEEQCQYDALVLALHGDDDKDGWGQAKRLPDGSSVTAADILSLSVPPLCVLGSCHSSIKVRDGGELAGFPLSLFLRGATTVIGGLYAIEDAASSEILAEFWRCYAESSNPVAALHKAKTTWLTDGPGRRRYPRRWAGLIVYGGAHH